MLLAGGVQTWGGNYTYNHIHGGVRHTLPKAGPLEVSLNSKPYTGLGLRQGPGAQRHHHVNPMLVVRLVLVVSRLDPGPNRCNGSTERARELVVGIEDG